MKRQFSPIKGQFPDPKRICCRDCIYRDRTMLTMFDPPKPVGVTKAFCNKYLPPPASNGKPHEILFQNAICKYYMKGE